MANLMRLHILLACRYRLFLSAVIVRHRTDTYSGRKLHVPDSERIDLPEQNHEPLEYFGEAAEEQLVSYESFDLGI